MAEQVEASALLDAVAAFLKTIEPELSARNAFHAKVAGNALAIVRREIEEQPYVVERAALAQFLGHDTGLDTLRTEICGRLRAGQLAPEAPGLLATLIAATLAKVAVDNPRYSTFLRMQAPR